MLSLLKKLYLQVEEIKGKKLLYLLITVFVSFTLIGLSIGYFTSLMLNIDETDPAQNGRNGENQLIEVSYEGRIMYVNPLLYPNDNISYSLVDGSGKELILLTATDQKLEVAEGHNVTVYGFMGKTADGKREVLKVNRVGIRNAAN
jgi:hypothetical protein